MFNFSVPELVSKVKSIQEKKRMEMTPKIKRYISEVIEPHIIKSAELGETETFIPAETADGYEVSQYFDVLPYLINNIDKESFTVEFESKYRYGIKINLRINS